MLSTVRDKLIQWDHVVWYYMNTQWHNSFFDAIVPFFRNQYFWAPLYLFLLLFMPSKFRLKGWVWCACFLVTFIISDQVSASVLKPYFHRLRPCNNVSLANSIHLIVNCGGLYGFPSSHATNHFSMGIFSAVTLSKKVKWIWAVAIAWATLVSFSQVYVGVHYPLDVTCGGMLGAVIGTCTGILFNRYFNLAESEASLNRTA